MELVVKNGVEFLKREQRRVENLLKGKVRAMKAAVQRDIFLANSMMILAMLMLKGSPWFDRTLPGWICMMISFDSTLDLVSPDGSSLLGHTGRLCIVLSWERTVKESRSNSLMSSTSRPWEFALLFVDRERRHYARSLFRLPPRRNKNSNIERIFFSRSNP